MWITEGVVFTAFVVLVAVAFSRPQRASGLYWGQETRR